MSLWALSNCICLTHQLIIMMATWHATIVAVTCAYQMQVPLSLTCMPVMDSGDLEADEILSNSKQFPQVWCMTGPASTLIGAHRNNHGSSLFKDHVVGNHLADHKAEVVSCVHAVQKVLRESALLVTHRTPVPYHNAAIRSAWVKLEADDYSAVVSANSIAAHASYGFLAHQVEFELAQHSRPAAVRLDCSSDVAKEVVQLLRVGPAHYSPPSDPRVLRALQHQLDYLGISCACVGSHHVTDAQEVLMLPSYLTPAISGNRRLTGGLPVYSSGAKGWALKAAEQHPWLQSMDSMQDADGFVGSSTKVAVLRAESTGAGRV
jgi:hypothetical protein